MEFPGRCDAALIPAMPGGDLANLAAIFRDFHRESPENDRQ